MAVNIEAAWQDIVDQVLALGGIDPEDIPTGRLEASADGDTVPFRSSYTGD